VARAPFDLGEEAPMRVRGVSFLRGKPAGFRPPRCCEGSSMALPMHVLFVCHANMCRSALAEGLAKKLAEERSLPEKILFRSSGLAAEPGRGAMPQAIKVAAQYGVDLTTHQTTPLTFGVADWADYMVAATRNQKRELIARLPVLRPRIYTFAEFVGEMTGRRPRWRDILDPVGGSEHDYQRCARLIYESLVSVFDALSGVQPRERSFLERLFRSRQPTRGFPF